MGPRNAGALCCSLLNLRRGGRVSAVKDKIIIVNSEWYDIDKVFLSQVLKIDIGMAYWQRRCWVMAANYFTGNHIPKKGSEFAA